MHSNITYALILVMVFTTAAAYAQSEHADTQT